MQNIGSEIPSRPMIVRVARRDSGGPGHPPAFLGIRS